jgi:hypothetical protein
VVTTNLLTATAARSVPEIPTLSLHALFLTGTAIVIVSSDSTIFMNKNTYNFVIRNNSDGDSVGHEIKHDQQVELSKKLLLEWF